MYLQRDIDSTCTHTHTQTAQNGVCNSSYCRHHSPSSRWILQAGQCDKTNSSAYGLQWQKKNTYYYGFAGFSQLIIQDTERKKRLHCHLNRWMQFVFDYLIWNIAYFFIFSTCEIHTKKKSNFLFSMNKNNTFCLFLWTYECGSDFFFYRTYFCSLSSTKTYKFQHIYLLSHVMHNNLNVNEHFHLSSMYDILVHMIESHRFAFQDWLGVKTPKIYQAHQLTPSHYFMSKSEKKIYETIQNWFLIIDCIQAYNLIHTKLLFLFENHLLSFP